MKRRSGTKHSVHYITSSMKKVARSVGRRQCGPIVKQVMSHPRMRPFILKRVGRLIRKDMERMCSLEVSSVLTPDAMKSFSWGDLMGELERFSPVFLSVAKGVCA